MFFFFFFQAEDGIRDLIVTGVQTCALPIWQFSDFAVVSMLLNGPEPSARSVVCPFSGVDRKRPTEGQNGGFDRHETLGLINPVRTCPSDGCAIPARHP